VFVVHRLYLRLCPGGIPLGYGFWGVFEAKVEGFLRLQGPGSVRNGAVRPS